MIIFKNDGSPDERHSPKDHGEKDDWINAEVKEDRFFHHLNDGRQQR
jgi:hypothetical protein